LSLRDCVEKSYRRVLKTRLEAPMMETRRCSLTLRKGAVKKALFDLLCVIAHPQGTHAALNYV